ncbi:MAG: SPFH domain-containing protein [Deltaproteobacteria bacterium]|nr:SPFH domain-containing protein [Deltaproteobacteria bacterium]
MKALTRVSQVIVIATLALWIIPWLIVDTVPPGMVGVRQSAVSGVNEDDLGVGWHWAVPGLHKLIYLPSSYFFLDYTNDDAGPQGPLQIRTKDNNVVELDVSVPVRIKPGEAHKIVEAGNHVADNTLYRYQHLADQTAVSVLREELAKLDSSGFYSTDKRLGIEAEALTMLNKALAELHCEAQAVLIRAVRFRPEYEKQLQQIQLNEQNKLLDNAKQQLALKQQSLDNYTNGTKALSSSTEQEWVRRSAELERAYQLGLLAVDDPTPGAARKKLAGLTPEQVAEVRKQAVTIFGVDDPTHVDDAYLIGIKNLEAETLEYKNRVTAEADGVGGKLSAQGDSLVAQVQGNYESKLNGLLNSPAGKAYVAYNAAANVTFNKTLTFSSQDGLPSVLRLRRFAEQFMGQ